MLQTRFRLMCKRSENIVENEIMGKSGSLISLFKLPKPQPQPSNKSQKLEALKKRKLAESTPDQDNCIELDDFLVKNLKLDNISDNDKKFEKFFDSVLKIASKYLSDCMSFKISNYDESKVTKEDDSNHLPSGESPTKRSK